MLASPETIQLRIEHRTAWITLDRPPLNILDIPMMKSFDAALKRALPKSDFVVLQGAGPKAFCAGADVADHTPKRVEKMLASLHAVFRRLAAADCLTIAVVHGFRSEEHTSELQSRVDLVCRLLLEKKKKEKS